MDNVHYYQVYLQGGCYEIESIDPGTGISAYQSVDHHALQYNEKGFD
jgi:hypothetical protein